MQKIVTIFLNSIKDSDCQVKEHLKNYIKDGWRVKSITPVGAGDGSHYGGARGWLAVL